MTVSINKDISLSAIEANNNSILHKSFPGERIHRMYIGIGLLAASLSFIIYQRLFSSSSGKPHSYLLPLPYSYPFDFLERTLGISYRQFDSRVDLNEKSSGREDEAGEEDHNEKDVDRGVRAPQHGGFVSGHEEEGEEGVGSASKIQGANGSLVPSFAFSADDVDVVGNSAGIQTGGSPHEADFQSTIVNEELPVSQSTESPPQPSRPPSGAPPQPDLSMPPPPPPAAVRPSASAKRKPSNPRTTVSSPNTLMPPPPPPPPPTLSRSRPSSTQPLLRKPAPQSTSPTLTLLQPPPSPSPSTLLRLPPSSRSNLAPTPTSLSTSTLPPPSRPSKKVLLEPGHSPLDWAHLTSHPPSPTFLRGASLPLSLIRVSPALLRLHNGRKGNDAWGVWQGKVYNLTPYLKFHPGGVGELLRAAGKAQEGERLFMEVHPWVSWEGILAECMVGLLMMGNEEVGGQSLEEMD